MVVSLGDRPQVCCAARGVRTAIDPSWLRNWSCDATCSARPQFVPAGRARTIRSGTQSSLEAASSFAAASIALIFFSCEVQCRERLGGLLRYYHRAAA